jgi:hypothetical protein
MRTRTLQVACDAEMARELGNAITAYAHVAYPAGGSDCAQVAREALLDVARQCAAHPGGDLTLRRRMLPQLRAAVRWCLSDDGPAGVRLRPAWATLLLNNKESA